ncbi:tetratricopeptide repeat protein [Nostoc sp.]|uniref:tetratricopeptide repeat protein n=1 Tax=Nostoc sp. TaxID=1180 RepID=UPI002FFD1E21
MEAVQLCQQVLAVFQDYRIFGTIARAEYFLGFVENAVVHYQQALNLCPDDDVTEKAGTLGNLAWVIAQQGDIEGALFLYQQSLEISERISDVRGKAITLQNMAGVIAEKGDIERALFLYQQTLELLESVGDFSNRSTTLNNIAKAIADLGDIERAVSLWHESLKISQSIGDVRSQVEILTNLAYIAGKTGDKDRQLDLNLQALQLCVKIRAYRHLVTVITNLGEADESKGLIYFAQATWLCLNIQVPLPNTMTIFAHLYQALPQENELQALLTTTTLFLCSQLDEDHPLFKELQILGGRMIIALTEAQGIETQQAFDTWIVQQRLNDPKYFLPRLNQRLEDIVGDGWLFDRSQVSMGG